MYVQPTDLFSRFARDDFQIPTASINILSDIVEWRFPVKTNGI